MYQIQLNRDVAEICIPTQATHDLSLCIVRQGDDSVYADMDTFIAKDGNARFRTNTEVHTLPIGLYTAVLSEGNCICCEYPIKITGCSGGTPIIKESKCTEELPPRDCVVDPCDTHEECPEETICDLYGYTCGNEAEEVVLNFPISATERREY